MSFSDYLETKVLNDHFRTGTVYLALFTSDPTDADTGVEVSGGNYSRQPITFGVPTTDADGSMKITNTTEIKFPIATASWDVVAHAGIFDAEVDGNLLDHSTFAIQREVQMNDQFIINAGNLTIKLN